MVNVLGTVATDASNHDPLALIQPLEDGSRPDAEPPTNRGGNRDLALRREPRPSDNP